MGQILIEAEIVGKVGFGPTRLLGHILPSHVSSIRCVGIVIMRIGQSQ